MIEKISLAEKFAQFSEHWSPRIIGELNGQHIKLARVQGEFVWHHHEEEDEMFLVVKGRLRIELRDGVVDLGEGELCIIPRGTEHRPVAESEAHILLFEPAGTLNTGSAETGELTVAKPETI